MIISAQEFKKLRLSDDHNEQLRASTDSASIDVWSEVIALYPDLKEWVAHNKTIQIEILEILATDNDPRVRCVVARKRKINDKIFDLLKNDVDESVRHALICNTKLNLDKKRDIEVNDSEWLRRELQSKLDN